MLRGTIRDHFPRQRRPFVRFFPCEQDLSHELPDAHCLTWSRRGRSLFGSWGAIAAG
jgi:hypothetical protein